MAYSRKPPPRSGADSKPAAPQPVPATLRDRKPASGRVAGPIEPTPKRPARHPHAASRAHAPRGPASSLLDRIPPHVRERAAAYAQLTRQDKPIGWLLLLWPTYWALWLAAGGTPPIGTLVIFTLGVVVMRSAGCAINDYADRWLDAKVQRTAGRPLATGRVTGKEALAVFGVLIAIALLLVLLTNRKTILLACGALALALVYPYAKRRTWWPQVWLGAAFGMSIPMAWTAVTDAWPTALPWLLFVANVLWSTAYDTFYAMVDRDDDLRAGAKSTAILFGDLDLVAIGLIHASFLFAMWLAGERAELGLAYRVAWGLAAAHVAWQLWDARDRSRERSFAAFRSNAWLGLALFLGIAVDYAMR